MSEPHPESFLAAFHSAKQDETTRLAAAKAAIAAVCTAFDSSVDAAPDGYVGLIFQMAADFRAAGLKDIRVEVAAGRRRNDLTAQTVIERNIVIWFDGRPEDWAKRPTTPVRPWLGQIRLRAFHKPVNGELLNFRVDEYPYWLSSCWQPMPASFKPEFLPGVLKEIATEAGRTIARLAASAG